MIYIAIASFILLIIRLTVSLVNRFSETMLPPANKQFNHLVSVLIPARNEEENIGRIIDAIQNQYYKNIELLIYDDMSTDQTARIINDKATTDSRIRYIAGKKLPKDWLGKSHACYQLANEARGQYFLFLDADMQVHRNFINESVAYLQKHQLALLSVFPQQIMHTWGEKLSVPIMNWVLLTLLPLPLIRLSKRPSLAAANGQFMLFDGEKYLHYEWHKLAKQQPVEDIFIIKKIKKQGLKAQTLVSNGSIQCRMYSGLSDSLQGFSRNVLDYFGGSVFFSLVFATLTVGGIFFVYFSMGKLFATTFLLLSAVVRVVYSQQSKQNVSCNLILAPLQNLIFLWLIFKAIYHKFKKQNTWKGRHIKL